jgi:hypothetical protein
MSITDPFLAALEVCARQAYWRWRGLAQRSGYRKSRKSTKHTTPLTVKAADLTARLHEIGEQSGGLLMVHSSVGRLEIVEEGGTVRRRGDVVAQNGQ